MPQETDIRYHPIFSKPFGQKKKNIYSQSGQSHLLENFLDQQFVFCQEYHVTDDHKYITKGLKMFSMKNTGAPIEMEGGFQMQGTQVIQDLEEPIQYIAHKEE